MVRNLLRRQSTSGSRLQPSDLIRKIHSGVTATNGLDFVLEPVPMFQRYADALNNIPARLCARGIWSISPFQRDHREHVRILLTALGRKATPVMVMRDRFAMSSLVGLVSHPRQTSPQRLGAKQFGAEHQVRLDLQLEAIG